MNGTTNQRGGETPSEVEDVDLASVEYSVRPVGFLMGRRANGVAR